MEATLKIVIEPSSEFLAALWSISAAMLGQKPTISAPEVKAQPVQTAVVPAAVMPQVSTPAPVAITPAPQQFASAAPMAPAPTAVPVPSPIPAAVPVATAPGYTLDQLGKAGAALVDAGKRDQLIGLLQRRGIQTLSQLDPSQYGAFATELRGLGAQI
ncbi:MAG: hypothetical protein VB035_00665 [Candidatus Fimivivens sp.]|nr:hypothetical protein [Candidatus Fimivivens sp.]